MATQADDRQLPTAKRCLLEAVRELEDGAHAVNAQFAQVWINLAREIREGSSRLAAEAPQDRLTLHDIEGIVCSHKRVAVRRKGGPGQWFVHTDDGSNCTDPDQVLRQLESASPGSGPVPAATKARPEAETVVVAGHQPPAPTWPDSSIFGAMPRTFVSGIRPGPPAALSAEWQSDPPSECRNCAQSVAVARPTGSNRTEWRHVATGDAVCAGRSPEGDESYVHGQRTYATPSQVS